MPRVFNRVGIPTVQRSIFNLSYEKKFTGKMGYLYPSMCDEVVPGDVFEIKKQIVVRFMPMVAPILHEINLYEHTFFVPYRLLMTEELGDDGDFEDMIIGGADGDTDIAIPVWTPASTVVGSLWDYFGFPIGVDPVGAYPVDFPKRAYNLIWNEYYRDIDLDAELDITTQESVRLRAWEKDYFTSSRPFQQRGTAPALPLTGTGDLDWPAVGAANQATMYYNSGTSAPYDAGTKAALEEGTVDFADATTFDVHDLRLAYQTTKWMERNMRAGTRYFEFLKAHFGVTVNDERLQRPEYIGGLRSPVIISEVLQTESSDASTDLGTMAGHGMSLSIGNVGRYRVKEYGLIISILSVIPRTCYSQGIDRQWRKDTLYDFYFPEFANLSEQAVLRSEIYANGVAVDNDTVFGYQGRYNEMRIKKSMACGLFAANQTFNYWTLGREFASAPTLSTQFIQSVYNAGFEGGIRSDVFAVTTGDKLMIQVGNIIKAARPLPVMAMPGLVDHN